MGIRSWGSRATRKFVSGDRGRFPPSVAGKIDDVLECLERGDSPATLRAAGYQIHRLTGDRKGAYAIAISGRWRGVFHFQDGNVYAA